MTIFVIILLVIISALGISIFFLNSNSTLSKIKAEKVLLEGRKKELETEKKILIKHAKDAKQKTITDEKELHEAKEKYYDKVGGRDIDAVMRYISGE